jgi:hypothetical protein
MLNRWNAVATLDRMFDDVMGAALQRARDAPIRTAASPRVTHLTYAVRKR